MHLVLIENPRDQSILLSISRLLLPGKTQKLQAIYENATKKPYTNLLIDLKLETPAETRFMSNVLDEDPYIISYVV